MQTANNQPGKSRLDIRFPFFIKAPMVLLGLYLLFYILVLLQDIFVPICFALLLAILLNPLVNTFNKFRLPRVLSIGMAILLAILAFGGLITFLSVQFASFSDLAPQLAKRSTEIFAELQSWA
ncbi:MAG TPA: AI-2E family transporter, partial [Flavihumibacter sp.]|nr:AI-2E family transporter [Flavihumibacter sp.]